MTDHSGAESMPGPRTRGGAVDTEMIAYLNRMRVDLTRFLMEYQFAVDEVLTKVDILRREFQHLRHYNPIEHVTSRVKTPSSILRKAIRKDIEPDLASIRETMTDIAGVRITCSFIGDTYRILDTLTAQDDVRLVEIKDYIATPKPNGYKSLHAIVTVPVFLSTGPVEVTVELQIRTVAMDFWASLEHKIFYKYEGHVPQRLIDTLTDAAATAQDLDRRMEELHGEVHGDRHGDATTDLADVDEELLRHFWRRRHSDGTSG